MVRGGRRALKGGQDVSSWRSGRGVSGSGKGTSLSESPGPASGRRREWLLGCEAFAVELYDTISPNSHNFPER